MVKKLRHLIKASQHVTVIYTDHQAIVDIAKQSSLNTTSVVRLNLRHVRSSEYLSRFRLDIRYKPGKSNIIPDALSRLPVVEETREFLADRRATTVNKDKVNENTQYGYPVAVVELSEESLTRIKAAYGEDTHCAQIMEQLEDNNHLREDGARLPFLLRRGLIDFDDEELGRRLVTPTEFDQELFYEAHDNTGHPGYARTHERLAREFYIFNMAKKLKDFVAHCPDCQVRRTPRHRPFGLLQPILHPAKPFHTLSIDFILALSASVPHKFDCAIQ